MKKRMIGIFLCTLIMITAVGCSSFSVSTNSVGKDNTTAKKMATVINEEIADSKRSADYTLYGIEMSMDAEGNGKAHLIYTKVLPENLKYSDIRIVTVDTRTGKVDSVKSADFSLYGTAPYETIINGAPLQIESWKQDSGAALSAAQNTFSAEENFVYNYAQISAAVTDGIEQYKITFVSLVNHLQYISYVDGMTGTVLKKEIVAL